MKSNISSGYGFIGEYQIAVGSNFCEFLWELLIWPHLPIRIGRHYCVRSQEMQHEMLEGFLVSSGKFLKDWVVNNGPTFGHNPHKILFWQLGQRRACEWPAQGQFGGLWRSEQVAVFAFLWLPLHLPTYCPGLSLGISFIHLRLEKH